MIYLVPTKHGIGVELWGHYEDLHNFHETIGNYWLNEDKILPGTEDAENREKVISGFSYEIRKAFEGSRLKRNCSHYFPYNKSEFFGTQISWVQFLFSLSVIRYNMKFTEVNKFDASTFLQMEWWLDRAMHSYDEIGATNLTQFIDGAIYAANDCIYQYMRIINLEYFMLKGGKKAFRQLPALLKKGIFGTDEYKAYKASLEADAKRFNCKPGDLEINDDNFNYEAIKW